MRIGKRLAVVGAAITMLMSIGVNSYASFQTTLVPTGKVALPSRSTMNNASRDGCSISVPVHVESPGHYNIYVYDLSGGLAELGWDADKAGSVTITWQIKRPANSFATIELDFNDWPVTFGFFEYPADVGEACRARAAKTPGPINCLTQKIFVAQGEDATTLKVKEYDANAGANSSNAEFADMGRPWTGTKYTTRYNAIAYNNSDGYIYGLADSASGGADLVIVGNEGVVQVLGEVKGIPADQSFRNNGAFLNGTYYFSTESTNVIYSLDLKTLQATAITLAGIWEASDFVQIEGYLWGIIGGGIYRLDVSNRQVARFDVNDILPFITDTTGGAVFAYSNGDFGVVNSEDGIETQIHITNASSANPTFSLVAQAYAPTSGRNDGTSCNNRLYA